MLPLFERGILADRVPLRRTATVYARFGDWFAYACLALSAGALGYALFEVNGAMLSELKRDLVDMDRRLEDLRGHL